MMVQNVMKKVYIYSAVKPLVISITIYILRELDTAGRFYAILQGG